MFEIKINKKVVFSEVNKNPKEFTSVSVYAGNPWYPAAKGKIRNLILSPRTNEPQKGNSNIKSIFYISQFF